jgi:hypothetical protein
MSTLTLTPEKYSITSEPWDPWNDAKQTLKQYILERSIKLKPQTFNVPNLTCSCGQEISRSRIDQHLKSKTHLKKSEKHKQKETKEQEDNKKIEATLKAFSDYHPRGTYSFLPETDLKNGIIHFVSHYPDGNASDDSIYGDGESEADEW